MSNAQISVQTVETLLDAGPNSVRNKALQGMAIN